MSPPQYRRVPHSKARSHRLSTGVCHTARHGHTDSEQACATQQGTVTQTQYRRGHTARRSHTDSVQATQQGPATQIQYRRVQHSEARPHRLSTGEHSKVRSHRFSTGVCQTARRGYTDSVQACATQPGVVTQTQYRRVPHSKARSHRLSTGVHSKARSHRLSTGVCHIARRGHTDSVEACATQQGAVTQT